MFAGVFGSPHKCSLVLPSDAPAPTAGPMAKAKTIQAIESSILSFLKTVTGTEEVRNQPNNPLPLHYSALRTTAQTLRIWSLVYRHYMRNTSVVKRDLYYSNVNLFGSQEVSDRIILQLYRSLFVGPTSLPIIPSAKGLVVGPVTWNLPDGSRVSAHERATLIPHEGVPSTTASCVILLEKESIFHLLTSSMLISMLNCLIVTGKGYPDVATRIFLQQLQMLHSLPILTFTDADPYGIDIYMCYKRGSTSNHYTPIENIVWLGVHLDDVEAEQQLATGAKDVQVVERLLEELEVAEAKDEEAISLKQELNGFLARGRKAEMEALLQSTSIDTLEAYIYARAHAYLTGSDRELKSFEPEE